LGETARAIAGRAEAGKGWSLGDKESSRFLKKAAQKLLLCWAMGVVGDEAHAPRSRKLLFVHKK
jgi:hypothetical protein